MYAATGLTYQEFAETMTFTKIRGPIGGGREDVYAVMQSMAVFAAQRNQAFDPRDHLTWLPKPEQFTDEDLEEYDPDNDE